ncbi:unnamed protein product [Urochloa humidicola]
MEELIAAKKPPTTLPRVVKTPETSTGYYTPREWSTMEANLLNLGGGRFCVAKVFERVESDEWPTWLPLERIPDFAVLTGVELVTNGGGDNKLQGLQIVVHKSVRYMFSEDRILWEL